MNNQNKVPILFIIFNRLELTLESFQVIKRYKPQKLYIAADGPRSGKLGEDEKCSKTREAILNLIDWDCEVFKLFRTENVGCGRGVSEGISWMFETEEYGVIIEDDCVVADSFLTFCEELLPLYANNEKVAQINGLNKKGFQEQSNTYSFTGYPEIWGWATWKRAWINLDFKMSDWKQVRFVIFKRFSFVEACIHYLLWVQIYKKIKQGKKVPVWSYQWSIYVFMNSKLCINPCVNLVKNIGFGVDGTNCSNADTPLAKLQCGDLIFPLEHPAVIDIDKKQEKTYSKEYVWYFMLLLIKKIKKTLLFK